MNIDNKDDLIVGAEGYTTSQGRAYVFLNDGSIPTTAGTADVTFTETGTSKLFGRSLAVADYDNSGTDDLFVGAPGRTTNTGRVYLYLNTTTSTITNGFKISLIIFASLIILLGIMPDLLLGWFYF